jgi:hypothetical protein
MSLGGMHFEGKGIIGGQLGGPQEWCISQHGGPVGGEGGQRHLAPVRLLDFGQVVTGTLALVPYGEGGLPCCEAGGGHVGGQGSHLSCMYSAGLQAKLALHVSARDCWRGRFRPASTHFELRP